MTVEHFVRMLNSNYGIEKQWPNELLVDSDTYANACQAAFINLVNRGDWDTPWDANPEIKVIRMSVGPHNGIMFKNIELILKS